MKFSCQLSKSPTLKEYIIFARSMPEAVYKLFQNDPNLTITIKGDLAKVKTENNTYIIKECK